MKPKYHHILFQFWRKTLVQIISVFPYKTVKALRHVIVMLHNTMTLAVVTTKFQQLGLEKDKAQHLKAALRDIFIVHSFFYRCIFFSNVLSENYHLHK